VSELRLLDLDIENWPISYAGSDFTFADITAIAWSWYGERDVSCAVQTKSDSSRRRMLKAFADAYREADMVTGHNIRRHDLPHLNGALMELGLPPLGRIMVSDTYADLKKRSGISASQENLAEMLDVPAPKIGMSQIKWRAANRLTPEGLELTRLRVVGDVVQHKALRKVLVERGLLGPARAWRG